VLELKTNKSKKLRFFQCTFPNQIKWRWGKIVTGGYLYSSINFRVNVITLTNGLDAGPKNKITKLLNITLFF
jgi:hypothetical protein